MSVFREVSAGKKRNTGREPVTRTREDWQQVCSEFNICKRKLQAKSEALLVLAKELDNVRQEKDAYKLMAEQLREKFHTQRKKYEERERALGLSLHDGDPLAERRNHTLVQILCESRKRNRKAELELSEMQQKLAESEGDIKLLRESIARQRVGDEGIGIRLFPAHEREELIRQLEKGKEQIENLERDMVAKIDEHQEYITERDYYRTKTERLNQELNYVLGGDDRRIVDIDALVMENKYLKERINQSMEEKASLQATASKYKSALERRRGKGVPKLGSSGGTVLSTKDVEQLLAQGKSSGLSASPASLGDLQALATSLLETIHDKNMALSHQKNTNKILGQRVAELEKKLKTLEVAGLWNLPAGSTARTAAFLAKEKKSMASGLKTLLPHQVSTSSDDIPRSLDGGSSLPSSAKSTPLSTPSHHGSSRASELTRQDTADSLIELEDHREATDDHKPRFRSLSSPSRHCHHDDGMQKDAGGGCLVDLDDQGGSGAASSRVRSQSSPSRSCHPAEVVRKDTEESLISLEEDTANLDKKVFRSPEMTVDFTKRGIHDIEKDVAGAETSVLVSIDDRGIQDGQELDAERTDVVQVTDDGRTSESVTRKVGVVDRDVVAGRGDCDRAAAQAERELLMNIYEIERGQADGMDREADDSLIAAATAGDDGGDVDIYSDSDQVHNEEDHLMSSIPTDVLETDESEASSPSAVLGTTTNSIENLFESVADKISLKSREKRQLEGKESTQPSSPLLKNKKEKQSSVVVIDNTPQCV